MRSLVQYLVCVVLAVSTLSSTGVAGGPENLLLVVNSESPSSLMIANHYIDLRGIPERNVVYLSEIPDREVIDVKVFKSKILEPILSQIEQRKLTGNIDYIVYSADFPTIIGIKSHQTKLLKMAEEQGTPIGGNKKIYNAQASINSVTYFAQAVMQDEPAYMLLNSNYYYRGNASEILKTPFLGETQKSYLAAVEKIKSDTDAAVAELGKLREQHPNQVAVLVQLAKAHAENMDFEEATEAMKAAITSGWSFRQIVEADPILSKAISSSSGFAAVVNQVPDEPIQMMPSIGFKRNRFWTQSGSYNRAPDQGRTYFLSTVLAVTRNHGCTERDALNSLKRNAVVDGTKPSGTFFFADTKDVRNRTRKPNYPAAIDALERLGMKAEIITERIPAKQSSVLGLTNGTAAFKWSSSGSKLLPGAICDNLTSHGGMLNRKSQTKCTAFIAVGAAGASGTVVEPYAIQAKFPHPMIHAHYARGCTLAESFYQSVHGPFQLLIVGDALCQPFASIPTCEFTGIKPQSVIKGEVEVGLDFSKSLVPSKAVELYLDGLRVSLKPASDTLKFDTTKIPDGYHELRIVPIADNALETTGRGVFPVFVNNHGNRVNLQSEKSSFKSTDQIVVRVQSNYGNRVVLRQNVRKLGEKTGKEAEFSIPAEALGRGPVELTAVALDENDIPVTSVPLKLKITGEIAKTKRQTETKK
jgi:uncharacterized protein (TIGR03790 family)